MKNITVFIVTVVKIPPATTSVILDSKAMEIRS